MDTTSPAGLYLHIPFCTARCPYCDFISTTDLDLLPDFLVALEREIKLRATDTFSFDTLYLGGGTPSLLRGEEVARLLGVLRDHFRVLSDTEITLEGNPGSLTPARLTAYLQAGVNRLNIGVQSFQDDHLRLLGRRHSAVQARSAIQEARSAGFTNIGLDLIYGLPGQTAEVWKRDLDLAVAAAPEHLSCYLLTFETGTRFDIRRRKGELKPQEDAAQAELFQLTRDHLDGAGYAAYEISNFARRTSPGGPDLRSRHNRKYWNHAPYLGLGPAAHSYRHPTRSWNEKGLRRYLKRLAAGELPVADSEILTPTQERMEVIMLALRQAGGLDREAWAKRFGERFEVCLAGPLARLIAAGQLEFSPPCYRLTGPGRILADGVVNQLVAALPADG
jgi:oxygen-independent coproporphyrinogen-3 oxidase